ncbi:MAG: hypothetical protein DMD78_10935 [Candidatus Rokuibacteriota bacterium]|nr:MAG: hypothetical protein DMD78_10935 [Candidatus Rokubacteria bacterium]
MPRDADAAERRRRVIRLLLLLVLLMPASPAAAASRFPASGDHDRKLGKRTYIVHVPRDAAARAPLPVVVAFHGGGGNATGFAKYAGLDRVADREGFVVVYPDGTGRLGRRLLTWNAGDCCGQAQERPTPTT